MSNGKKNLKKLRLGFFNVFHLANKVDEIGIHLKKAAPFHIFGLNETRLKEYHDDSILHISNYIIHRRDSNPSLKHTGIAAYVHTSICILKKNSNITQKKDD